MLAWYRIWPFLGRILMSGIFLFSGYGKVMSWQPTIEYMTSKGIPFANFFLFGATAIEFLGGLMVLSGIRARIGAVALIIYLIPTSILFHGFWNLSGAEAQLEMIQFLKNMAILGGLLHIASPIPPQPLFRRS